MLDAARKALASAEGRDKAAGAEYTAAQNRAMYAIGDDSFDALSQAGDAAFNQMMAASEAVGSAKSAIAELEKQARSWNSGHYTSQVCRLLWPP